MLVYSQDTRSENANHHSLCAQRHLQVDQNLESNSSDYEISQNIDRIDVSPKCDL
jgi:hypothetical protein